MKKDKLLKLRKHKEEIGDFSNEFGKFDPETDSITSWIKKYEIACDIFEWTDKQRCDNLVFFIDSGLYRCLSKLETEI